MKSFNPSQLLARIDEKLASMSTTSAPPMPLREFIPAAWHVVEPAQKFIGGFHVDAITDHAEACLQGAIKRLLINIPPGMSKSIIISVMFPCWVWTFKPWFRFLCASYDQDTANDLAQKRRVLLSSEWYRERWPTAGTLKVSKFSKARDTIKLIQNVAGGEMLATSPKGRALGKHPHGKIYDDLENPKDSDGISAVTQKVTRGFLNGPMATRGEAKDINAFSIMIAQRLDPKDASAVFLEGGCEHLCLPMRYDPDHPVRNPKIPTSIGFVDPRTEKGELLCPERYGEAEVEQITRELRHKASGQLQQNPISPEGDRFKRAWFKVITQVELPADFYTKGKAVRYWDKAGTEGGGDWTAGVLLVQHGGKFYVYDVVRGQWGSANRKLQMKQTSERDSALFSNYTIWQEQEPGSGGKESAELTETELAEFKVRTEKVTDPKKSRYDGWEEELDCVTNPRSATVYLVEGAWNQAFIDEHTAWRWEDRNPTDNQIDAASGAYTKLRKRRSFGVGIA